MPGYFETRSPSSEGEEYPDERNRGIPELQNASCIRIHGVKEVRF